MIGSRWNRFNTLMKNGTMTATERIEMLLHIACEMLEMPAGCLTVLHDNQLEIAYSTSSSWQGTIVPVSQMLCQYPLNTGQPLLLDDTRLCNWREMGIARPFQFGAYTGIALTSNGQVTGTLFFADHYPRMKPFPDQTDYLMTTLAASFAKIRATAPAY